jgi:hypothetical protein
MATDLSQFPVPNDRFDVAQDNAAKLDSVVNGPNAVVTTRTGKGIQSIDRIIESIAAVTDRGPWAGPGTSYQVKDLVTDTGIFYIAVIAHTSGATFAGDVVNWRVYQSIPQVQGDERYGVIFETTGAMQASSPVVGQSFETQGFTTAGDGGGADYIVELGDTSNAFDRLLNANGTTSVLQVGIDLDVRQFGAGVGAADDSPALQAVSSFVVAHDYQAVHSAVSKAGVKVIPLKGTFVLLSKVVSPDMIVWDITPETVIDETKLTGAVWKNGRHINAIHSGILENATSLSVRAGVPLDDVSGVYGITTEDAISTNGPPHSVTLQLENGTEIVPLTLTGTTYTATNVVYTNTLDLSDVKTGATITSLGSTTHTAIITGLDEGAKTIAVAGGWRPFTGSPGSTGTPTNGDDAAIDYWGKIWAQNTNVTLASGHPTTKMAGYELGMLNSQQDAPVFDPTVEQNPSVWGFDAINLGTFKGSAAHLARAGGTAAWRTGFASFGSEIAFQVLEKTSFNNTTAFDAIIENGRLLKCTRGGQLSYSVQSSGIIEQGRQDVAQTTTTDLHSSGNVNDYDVRLESVGGSASAGEGTYTIRSLVVQILGVLRPVTDNVSDFGQLALRWLNVFAVQFRPGDGTVIWTSGTGTPEAAVSAPIGSLFTRTDGGASTTLYIKESGAGNTGWVAK